MNKKRLLAMTTALALTATVAIGGTLAYLSAQSNEVENTFTVGEGYIVTDGLSLKLDEIDITKNDGSRTMTGNTYEDLYPGDVLDKDPTVYLTGGSVKSYVFAKVTGVDALEDVTAEINTATGKAFEVSGWDNSYWTKVADVNGNALTDGSTTGDGIYVANLGQIVDLTAQTKGEFITLGEPLFTTVTMNPDLTALPTGDLPQINVSACAVQYSADQMSSYADAIGSATFSN